MSEINNNGFNPNKDIKIQKHVSNEPLNMPKEVRVEKQQTDASSPVSEYLGKSVVKVDNHDADMRRLLANPEIAELSDNLYEAALRAGVSAPEAATFATSEVM